MKDKQEINQEIKRNLLLFFEEGVYSVLRKYEFRAKYHIRGGVF
jgi:hypothetical protein